MSIYPFRMTDANMKRHKYSNFKDFWEQLKPGYDDFEQTRKPLQLFLWSMAVTWSASR